MSSSKLLTSSALCLGPFAAISAYDILLALAVKLKLGGVKKSSAGREKV